MTHVSLSSASRGGAAVALLNVRGLRLPKLSLIRRGLMSLMLIVALAVVPTTPPLVAQSSENTRYAAIVVDAETGEVLFARHADTPPRSPR